jgi:hypothetical protein
MFQDAIAKNSRYVFPVYTGVKFYGSDEILNGIATMIALNQEGWFLTCRHVADSLCAEAVINARYLDFQKEFENEKENRQAVIKKYNISNNQAVLLRNILPFTSNKPFKVQFIFHDYLDLAAIHIDNLDLKLENYPVFSKNNSKQGKSLCKLGFPFPEYDYFKLNNAKNSIITKQKGRLSTPLFPLDGMMTRDVVDKKGIISLFEMSSPGIRGQSGGPIFDSHGILFGMQVETRIMDLAYDINGIVSRGSERKQIDAYSFLYLGIGINSSTIRSFLDENKIKYNVSV